MSIKPSPADSALAARARRVPTLARTATASPGTSSVAFCVAPSSATGDLRSRIASEVRGIGVVHCPIRRRRSPEDVADLLRIIDQQVETIVPSVTEVLQRPVNTDIAV